jgi:hypothetical protein
MLGTYSASSQSSPTQGLIVSTSTSFSNDNNTNNEPFSAKSDSDISLDHLEIENVFLFTSFNEEKNNNIAIVSQDNGKQIASRTKDDKMFQTLRMDHFSPLKNSSDLILSAQEKLSSKRIQTNTSTSQLNESSQTPLLNAEHWKDMEFFAPCSSLRLHKEYEIHKEN